MALSDTEEAVLSALKDYGESSTHTIAEATGVSERRTRRTLSKLVGYGLVASEGANKNRIYRIFGQDG